MGAGFDCVSDTSRHDHGSIAVSGEISGAASGVAAALGLLELNRICLAYTDLYGGAGGLAEQMYRV